MNELVVMEKLKKFEKQILAKRDKEPYPIQSTLREELNSLKKSEIGNLRKQIMVLRQTKYDQYCELHQKKVEQEEKRSQETIEKINSDYQNMLKQFEKQTLDFFKATNKKLQGISFDDNKRYKVNDLKLISTHMDYRYSVNFSKDKFNKTVMKEDFDKKYGQAFQKTFEKIDFLEQKFNEAVVFGDIQIVKEIYYTLKQADQFLKKLEAIKLK